LADAQPASIGSRAQAVAEYIETHGASFFEEIREGTGLLRAELEEALAELVALGLVRSDSFAGLRALLTPPSERRIARGRSWRRTSVFEMEDAGRWGLVRGPKNGADAPAKAGKVEHVARALLARYGIVFWRLLHREAAYLPPWRELLQVYRRLESRGEIRGGRFVAGFAGEQYALPEAVAALRAERRKKPDDEWIVVSGADPLNLVGIVTPGARLPALTGNRLLYRNGVPVADLAAGEVRILGDLDPTAAWQARNALLRTTRRAPSILPAVDEGARELPARS
jgi:ATP-dependent Lhr-like helicase